MATPLPVYKYSQINPVNTNNEWVIESVRINGASVLGGSCFKFRKHLLLERKAKEKEKH